MGARSVAASLLLALALSACSSGAPDPGPTATIGAPSTSPSAIASPSEDPWAVPDEITVEYVERVILELEGQRAQFFEAIRTLEPGTPIPDSAVDILRAFNSNELAEAGIPGYQGWVDDGDDSFLRRLRQPTGRRLPVGHQIGVATPDCIAVVTRFDFSDLLVDGEVGTSTTLLVLRPTAVNDINPSSWLYTLETTWAEAGNSRPFTAEDGAERCE